MSTVRKEFGILEFTYSWNEWKEFQYLLKSEGSLARALQTQIESGNIRTLDEVIQWAHLGERILKGEPEPPHQYVRGYVNRI